ncbi:MAG: hypothetical protein HDKAJFGB_01470 [Anaerolineae bacterium]|nr:hypothetical protein [Anaerolineae bacterium]
MRNVQRGRCRSRSRSRRVRVGANSNRSYLARQLNAARLGRIASARFQIDRLRAPGARVPQSQPLRAPKRRVALGLRPARQTFPPRGDKIRARTSRLDWLALGRPDFAALRRQGAPRLAAARFVQAHPTAQSLADNAPMPFATRRHSPRDCQFLATSRLALRLRRGVARRVPTRRTDWRRRDNA